MFVLSCLRVQVDDRKIPSSRTRIKPLKNKLLRAGYIAQRQIFRRRADKNEIVVLGIVQREQATTLDPYLPVQRGEYPIEIMYRQHLSHSGVMVENQVTRVARRIEIAHSRFRAPNESPIAENDPRLLRAGEKSTPERSKHRRGRLDVPRGSHLRFGSRFNEGNDNRQCGHQQNRERNCGPSHFWLRLRRDFWTELPRRGMRTLMERENVSPLRHLHNNGIIR